MVTNAKPRDLPVEFVLHEGKLPGTVPACAKSSWSFVFPVRVEGKIAYV